MRTRVLRLTVYLLALAQGGCAPAAGPAATRDAVPLPARFEADMVIVRPVTERGDTLELEVGTGGGGVFLYEEVAKRLDLFAGGVRPPARRDDRVTFAPWPRFRPGDWIPEPRGGYGARFVLSEPGREDREHGSRLDAGYLGAPWFGGRVWTIDYPGAGSFSGPRAASLRTTARTASLSSSRPTPRGGDWKTTPASGGRWTARPSTSFSPPGPARC